MTRCRPRRANAPRFPGHVIEQSEEENAMSHDGFKIVHGGDNLTSAQRREFEKNSAEVEKISTSDRNFFERFPLRQHRLRVAGRYETENCALVAGHPPSKLPPGQARYVIVKNLRPGVRLKMMLTAREGLDADMPEQHAREFFEKALELLKH